MYYKASRMLHHYIHPTDPIWDKKTKAFDTSMASPSRQHNFAVTVSHRYIVTVSEFGRSRRVWVHPPSLVAPAKFLGCFKVIILAAKKIADSPVKSDVKMGPQTHLGAESQSEGTI